MKLLCDKSIICIARNHIQQDRTKQTEIDQHFVKEKLDSGLIAIEYIPLGHQPDDEFTKGLPTERLG